MDKIECGFIVFDKSERSLRGLAPLVAKNPETTTFVTQWIEGSNEVLLWVLAVHQEKCRVIAVPAAQDLLGGALEEFADDLGEKTYCTRIATGPLPPEFAKAVRERWRKISGLTADAT